MGTIYARAPPAPSKEAFRRPFCALLAPLPAQTLPISQNLPRWRTRERMEMFRQTNSNLHTFRAIAITIMMMIVMMIVMVVMMIVMVVMIIMSGQRLGQTCDFEVVESVEQKVFRFKIAMGDPPRMAILYAWEAYVCASWLEAKK